VPTSPVPAPAAPSPVPIAPSPAPASSCVGIGGISRSTNLNTACGVIKTGTHYFNSSNFCNASVYYGLSCSGESNGYYVSNGASYRYWNGSSLSSCTKCEQQQQ
jgi:hypothetical protein